MSNYTQKFRLGTVWGRLGGRPPGSPLEFPLVRGNCAYVARGIDAPVMYTCVVLMPLVYTVLFITHDCL